MEYDKIVKILAPCGLDCKRCVAYYKSGIKRNSIKLKEFLGSFDEHAEKGSKFIPVLKNYPSFKELLSFFAKVDCQGCRSGKCKTDCAIYHCYKTKGIDFCFQCDEFPCDKTNFESFLKERWLEINNRMKDIGVEAYYEESKDLPRY